MTKMDNTLQEKEQTVTELLQEGNSFFYFKF